MMLNPQLEDDNNTPFELINSSEAEATQLSPVIKKQLETIVIQTFHKDIVPTLTDTISRVVKERIESALAPILSSKTWNSRNEIHASESRSLQLRFLNNPSPTVVTGKQIEGVEVELFDAKTGERVKCGHESSAKVEIVALEGDFNNVEGHDWTIEEFNQKIVRESQGKKSLLTGDAFLNLKNGIGTVGNISFTHNSNHMKVSKFRLGARVVDYSNGTVREAISESFIVKDPRNTRKHYPPSLSDEVWRLKNIGKNGPLHERLSKEKITTVKDFLILFNMNRQRLYDIFKRAGTKSVDDTIKHALTCKLDETVYLYRPSSQQKNGVVFNVVGELKGQLLECKYEPIEKLYGTEKDNVHKLVAPAFEHREDFESFKDITSLVHSQTQPSNSPRLENPSAHNADMQPHTSSSGTFSDISPIMDLSMYDISWSNNDNMDFTSEQLPSDPGMNYNPQPGIMTVELPAAEQSGGSQVVWTTDNNYGTRHMIDGNDDMQPSTSSMDDFDCLTDDNFFTQILILNNDLMSLIPSNMDDEQMLILNNDLMSLIPSNMDDEPQPGNLTVELPAAEQSATSSTQNRWGMLFIVLLRVKIKRNVGSNNVQKKQRCC